MNAPAKPIEVALIGGSTMIAFIKQLQPDWSIQIFESLGDDALESSNP